MTTPEQQSYLVINGRLFDPSESRLVIPGEGAIGISETACRILSDLAANPGAPAPSTRIAQSATPNASPDDAQITGSIAELNRLLGRLPSGALPIVLSDGIAYALSHEALANQPAPDDPGFRPKPFHKRPATWAAPIAVILALIAIAAAVSYSSGR